MMLRKVSSAVKRSVVEPVVLALALEQLEHLVVVWPGICL